MAGPLRQLSDSPGIFEVVPGRDGLDVLIVLRGELDLAGAPTLSNALLDVAGAGGSRVVLDLSDLGFIDASGIGAIARGRDRLWDRGWELIVRHPQPAVRRVLELCDAEGWLEELSDTERERPALDLA